MGNCQSAGPQVDQRTLDLDARLEELNEADEMVTKLLLLGAGGSGKSTLFKQMIKLYGSGYPEDVRVTYTRVIYSNIVSSVRVLLDYSELMNVEDPAHDCLMRDRETFKILDALDALETVTPELVPTLKAFWADEGIQNLWKIRNQFQAPDSAPYWFEHENLDRIATDGYIPSEKDILRARVRTTGIVETAFEIRQVQFKMFDVGGQRNERKKWIHCFEDVAAVMFVGAVSAYDQVLYEDETKNRVEEAVELFEDMVNCRWFAKTDMILFLNKRDLFEEKIEFSHIADHFPAYTGPKKDSVAGSEFIRDMFLAQNKNKDKTIHCHIVCGVDSENVERVFQSVSSIIMKKGMSVM